jgi:hypothetical protein
MFSFEDFTAQSVATAVKETGKLQRVGVSVTRAMTSVFAAMLAANPTLSVKAASVMIGDKVPLSKLPGVASKAKSEARAYFDDAANAKALRDAISNPSAMDAETFNAAIATYVGTINPRKWVEEQKAADKAAKAAGVANAEAGQRALGDDETAEVERVHVDLNPGFDPVLDAQTSALKAIANLSQMPETDETLTALYAILDAVTAALGAEVQQAVAA